MDLVEEAWIFVHKGGPCALSRQVLDHLEPQLTPAAKAVLRSFLEGIERQAIHYERRNQEIEHDADRIAKIGRTMQRAGLKSYVDEKGRIYTAP